ncbi:MAG: homoserine kinase [Acinetobacter sp.]|nr:homoserine kinase [Acinetobacter sp.]
MSVYTPLQLQDVQQFAKRYALTVERIDPIQEGVQNTNYFVICQDGEYVLTVFEDLPEERINAFIPVLHHLQQNGVNVPAPLVVDGQALFHIAGKPAQLAPRFKGKNAIATVGQTAQLADAQAKMHVVLQDFNFENPHKNLARWWSEVIPHVASEMTQEDQQLLTACFAWHDDVRAKHTNRPKGLIHADLFRDNSLFIDDELQCILDFSEVHREEFLYDIAITLNDFCSQADGSLNAEKYQAYLTAYEKVRPLTADEHACLAAYLAVAACHFWLFRLNMQKRNRLEGRLGSDVQQKDPNEMKRLLQVHLAKRTV